MKDLDKAIKFYSETEKLKNILNISEEELQKYYKCDFDYGQIARWLKELNRFKGIKNEIKACKQNIYQFNKGLGIINSEYLKGYICALSAVEGMIAEAED